jgi:hypothetical protein
MLAIKHVIKLHSLVNWLTSKSRHLKASPISYKFEGESIQQLLLNVYINYIIIYTYIFVICILNYEDTILYLLQGLVDLGMGLELGDMTPEMPAGQTSPKLEKLSPEAVLGILSSFPRKAIVGHTPRVLMQGRKNSRRRTPARIPLYSY